MTTLPGPIRQIGYVVTDLDQALASWVDLGVGPWLVIRGLRTHGQHDRAAALSANVQRLAVEHEFPEYVDPWSGAPHGAHSFSWTAALALDLQASDR